jgi:hypothetical protein
MGDAKKPTAPAPTPAPAAPNESHRRTRVRGHNRRDRPPPTVPDGAIRTYAVCKVPTGWQVVVYDVPASTLGPHEVHRRPPGPFGHVLGRLTSMLALAVSRR